MKITLLAVSSTDGFITRGSESNIYEWTSPEDSKLFFEKIEDAKLIFMGAKTYGVARHFIKHKEGRKRIVFTKSPEKYKSEEVPGFLEFTSEDPEKIIKANKDTAQEALLVGGSEINSLFLKQGLVNEVHLTIEPLLFGDGKKMSTVSSKLELLSCEELNKIGTLLLKYKVIN